MTIKTIVIAAACLTAGILSAADVKVGNNEIMINGSKITWDQEAGIHIRKNGQESLAFYFRKFYMKNNEPDWRSLDSKNNTVTKKGNTFTWNLKRTFDGKTYSAGTQTLEVLADGKLKYSLTFNTIKAPGWVPRSKHASVFVYAPYALYDNTAMKYNGKDCKLTQTMKWGGRDKNSRHVFAFNSKKNGTLTVSADNKDMSGISFYPDKWTKSYRLSFDTNAKGTLTVIIDVGK